MSLVRIVPELHNDIGLQLAEGVAVVPLAVPGPIAGKLSQGSIGELTIQAGDVGIALSQQVNGGKVLMFRRTKGGVDNLAEAVKRQGIAAAGIHGGLAQSERNAAMRSFHAGTLKVLVATNVAARGLDIPFISHVVNYDMPQNLEEYVHRIGRTARMGRDGTAITFVTEWDFPMLDLLQENLGSELKLETLAL